MSQPSKIAVKFIQNPFEPLDRVETIFIDHMDGLTAEDYVRQICAEDGEIVLSVNGSICEIGHIVQPNDSMCFCIVPSGGDGDGKSVLRTVAMIIVIAAATYVSGPYGGAATAKGFLVYAGVAVAGSMLVNALLPVSNPETKKLDNPDIDTSPNYGWGAPYNQIQEGAALPRLIGTRRFAPPRIGGYRFIPPNDQTGHLLRMQYALCDDVIDVLDLNHVFINGKQASDFNNIRWFYNNGDIYPEEPPAWFHDTITEKSIGANLDDAEELYTEALGYHNFVEGVTQPAGSYDTLTGDITTIGVKLTFPGGLITQKAINATDWYSRLYPTYRWVQNSDFRFKLEYRLSGGGGWTEAIWAPKPNQGYSYASYLGTPYGVPFSTFFMVEGLTTGNYDVRFSVSEDGGQAGDFLYVDEVKAYSSLSAISTQTTNGTEVTSLGVSLYFPGGLYYVNNDGSFANHQVEIVILVRSYGTSNWTRNHIETINESTATPFRRFVYFDDLAADQYEVRCYTSGVSPAGNRYQHTVQFEYIQEGISQSFLYPGAATLCIEIPASDVLYNSWPVIEVEATQLDYDSGSKASDNPAWASYYKILDADSAASINLTNFTTWANFCDAEAFTCGMYLDTVMSLPALLSELGRAGSATVMQIGSQWDVIIDDVASPVQTFGSNNIIEGTFEEVFLATEERANTLIVWFFDSDNNNRRTAVRITDNESASTDVNTAEYTLYAVTNKTQATKLGMRMLNSTRLTIRSMSWMSDIDAINCRVGDVVYLQNDLPVWGVAPGRVVSATSNTVTVDIAKDYDDGDWNGRDLRLLVRHQTDTTASGYDVIERHPIVNPYPNTAVVTYSLDGATFDDIPAAGAMVLIGWVTGTEASTSDELISVKQVRVVNIEQNRDLTAKLTAVDYYDDASIDSYTVTLPTPESGLTVGNVGGSAAWVVSGRVNQDFINLTWTGDAPKFYIFYRKNTTDVSTFGPWELYTVTQAHSLRMTGLPAPHTYEISVSAYPTPDTSNKVTVTFNPVDHGALISAVTNLRCVDTGDTSWDGKDLDLTWDDYTDFSLSYYKVEILDAGDVVIRTTKVLKHYFTYTLELNRLDNGGAASATPKVRVTVVDDSGNESSTAITTFTNASPSPVTNLLTIEGSATVFSGKTVDVVWDASTDEDFEIYAVEITHGGATLRTVYTLDSRFSYSYEMNTEDGSGTPSNSVVINVRVRDVFGLYSGYTTGTFTNPAPSVPGSLASTPWMNGLEFSWAEVSDNDLSHYLYRTQVESEGWSLWFRVATAQRVFVFLDDTQTDAYPTGATVSFEVKSVDTFGSESSAATDSDVTGSLYIPYTALTDFEQISGAFYEVPVLRDFVWSSNSPSAGYISWTAGTIYYNGTTYNVSSGNTSYHYVYWWPSGSTTLLVGQDQDSAIPAGAFRIAVNNSGVYSLIWNNAFANQVVGSAWIRDAAIITAKIDDLAVTNAKINDLDAAKIQAGTILVTGMSNGLLGSLNSPNVVTDPNFNKRVDNGTDFDYWYVNDAAAVLFGAYGENSTNGAQVSVGAASYKYFETPDTIAVENGEKWYIKARVYLSADYDASNFVIYMATFDKNGANETNQTTYPTTTKGSWHDVEGSFTISDSDAAFAKIRCLAQNDGSTGYARVSNLYVSKVAPGATDNSGWEYSGDSTYIDGGKIYTNTLTATQINGAGFGNLTISSGTITIQTTDGLTISGSGNVLVSAGNSINFTGHDSGPGKVRFVGSSYSIAIGVNANGSTFSILPESDNVSDLYLGGTGWGGGDYEFKEVHLNADYRSTARAYHNSQNYSYLQAVSNDTTSSSIDLECRSNNTYFAGLQITCSTTLQLVGLSGSSSHKGVDLATASKSFDDVYGDDFNNVADFYHMDVYDDIGIIKRIKPSPVIDARTGLQIIDDSSLDPILLVKHKSSGWETFDGINANKYKQWNWAEPGDVVRRWKKGDIALGNDGKPFISNKTMSSLLMGCVRKLQEQIDSIKEQVSV